MSVGEVINIMAFAFRTVLHVAGPVLVASLVAGLLISVFQSVTQIHEMTLTFIPKIIAVAMVLYFTMPTIIGKMVQFAVDLFKMSGGLKP